MKTESGRKLLAIKELGKMQQVNVVIFDMDGTLYQLDGEEEGMFGSSLERGVLANSRQFILEREGCSASKAEAIVEMGLQDSIGLSNFLVGRYGITRENYFNVVWNIDPEGIVRDFEEATEVVKELAGSGKKLILLTSAPKVWQEQVIKFLGLEKCFTEIYTGEDYGQKREMFVKLSQRYDSDGILSIGDQLVTDIQPAQELGMETFLVNSPSDLKNLLLEKGGVYEQG